MKVALAADHAAVEFKAKLARDLERMGHEVTDYGTETSESCDYPDFAIPAARSVGEGRADRAILACTNGIGMAMAANRIPGVRGALVYNARTAAMTRQHHDSNVLCLGAGEFSDTELLDWVRIWLDAKFEGGRHARRIAKLAAIEADRT